jgi:hypothetical protein
MRVQRRRFVPLEAEEGTMTDGKANGTTLADTIDIPVPSEELRQSALASEASIEIDEIPQKTGHFAVGYRRC